MNARIIRKEDLPEDTITLGKIVTLRNVASGAEIRYTILGEGETDIDKGIISYQSPLAQALITHKKDEEVEVQLPRGTQKFKILAVDFFDLD